MFKGPNDSPLKKTVASTVYTAPIISNNIQAPQNIVQKK
jgi:hypothetical protein